MKKTFISIILVMVLCLTLTTMLPSANQPTFADEDSAQYVMTMGCGEILTEADTLELNFGLTKVSDSLENGNEELNAQLDEIKSAINAVDSDAKVNLGYYSCYPISNGGTLQYQFSSSFVVTLTNIDKKDEIISTVAQNGATSFHGARLVLDDKQEAYNQALVKARDDAQQKAETLYGDVTLKEMFEINICSYELNGEIRVEACVKAKFQINGTKTSQKTQENIIPNVPETEIPNTTENTTDTEPSITTPRQNSIQDI